MNKITYIFIYLVFGGMTLYTGNRFFSSFRRIDGILLCIAMLLLSVPSLLDEVKEYRKAKAENNAKTAGSVLLYLSYGIGLVFCASGVAIYMLVNWHNMEW